MGYEKEKLIRQRKSKKIRLIIYIIVFVLIASVTVFSFFVPASTWKYYFNLPKISSRKDGELRIHFLDVGQADCTIIELPDGKSMIIDGGNNYSSTSDYILRYSNALKIKKFDYLVLTNPKSERSGGLDEVLKLKGAKYCYVPAITKYSVDKNYAVFMQVLQSETAKNKTQFEYSGAYKKISETEEYNLCFLSPSKIDNPLGEYNTAEKNNYSEDSLKDTSAVICLEYNGVSAMFCSDITSNVEDALLIKKDLFVFDGVVSRGLNADILKVSDHGSDKASSEKFLQELGVKEAIISCGKNNSGLPNFLTLQKLENVGANIHRTDEDGTIIVTVKKDGSIKVA